MNSPSFEALVARLREKKLLQATQVHQAIQTIVAPESIQTLRASELSHITDKYGNEITLNEKQQHFTNIAATGQSAVLIGAAGTGKTTCMKAVVNAIIHSSNCRILQNHDHRYLPHDVPGIVICAYTRRATNNIRRNMDDSMKANCITFHKLLEYQPVFYEVTDPLTGNLKKTMKFEATRTPLNPLPEEITTIVVEESSMLSTELMAEVKAALAHEVQFIYLGDIQQLPPVFGPAVLGFEMLELGTVELTEVYRQALESPIIRLAHRILSGNPIPHTEYPEWTVPGELKIVPWKKKVALESAIAITEKLFTHYYEIGEYNPEEDMILIPFNKGFGSIELNKSIAQQIALRHKKVVWEVMAGFMKHYFSVGDKVMFDREDAIILDIFPNPTYTGVPVQKESIYLDYWGHDNTPKESTSEDSEDVDSLGDIDALLGAIISDDTDRVSQCSHCIKLRMLDSDTERVIQRAADVNLLLLGYVLTIHKAQGSEWEKIFLLLHNSHANMLQRELLYTGVTRAKKQLTIVCEKDSFTNGILSQRIKGNTLEEKAIYFQGRKDGNNT